MQASTGEIFLTILFLSKAKAKEMYQSFITIINVIIIVVVDIINIIFQEKKISMSKCLSFTFSGFRITKNSFW